MIMKQSMTIVFKQVVEQNDNNNDNKLIPCLVSIPSSVYSIHCYYFNMTVICELGCRLCEVSSSLCYTNKVLSVSIHFYE